MAEQNIIIEAAGAAPQTVHCTSERVTVLVKKERQGDVRLFLPSHPIELDITVEDYAQLTLVVTGETNAETVINQTQHIGAHACLHLICVTTGNVKTHAVHSVVNGEHGESTIDWLLKATGDMQQRIAVRNVFLARQGRGEVTMKAVVQEKAKVDLEGMIEIGLQGGGTDTYLTERALMLDPTANVHATPGLEIKTNDVKASHSATVEHVRPEDSFYLTSRGIDPATARHMCVQGFLAEMAERIPVKEWQEDVLTLLQN